MNTEKYKIKQYDIRNSKGYEINKKEEENFTVNELKEIFEELIRDGKGNYIVLHEGFCCGTSCIDIMTSAGKISLD